MAFFSRAKKTPGDDILLLDEPRPPGTLFTISWSETYYSAFSPHPLVRSYSFIGNASEIIAVVNWMKAEKEGIISYIDIQERHPEERGPDGHFHRNMAPHSWDECPERTT